MLLQSQDMFCFVTGIFKVQTREVGDLEKRRWQPQSFIIKEWIEVAFAGPWTLEQLKTFLMTFIKSLNITKGSFTVRCSKVDHGFRDMKTLPLCIFSLNGSFQAFVGWPLERDGFWMMAVHLWKVKMCSEREGKRGLLFAICLETSQN